MKTSNNVPWNDRGGFHVHYRPKFLTAVCCQSFKHTNSHVLHEGVGQRFLVRTSGARRCLFSFINGTHHQPMRGLQPFE